jgi:hypothetical protein
MTNMADTRAAGLCFLGHRLVTEEVTMERSVRRLVELVANHVDGV